MTNIAIFTGSRSDFGLFKHLALALEHHYNSTLYLIVSGNHFSEHHGYTFSEILEYKFTNIIQVPLDYSQGDPSSFSESFVEASSKISLHLRDMQIDILCVLGDRYEAFAAATAAFLCNIKVAHFHGGETTLGAVDNTFRHCITHLSSFHFTSADIHQKRVLSLVPDSSHVYNIGPMVLDSLSTHKGLSRFEYSRITNYTFSDKINVLVTFHPVTLDSDLGISAFENLLSVLSDYDCNILFTSPNGDLGSSKLIACINNFIQHHHDRSMFISSLGHDLYLSSLKLFDVVVGNSSSGIIEAPLVGVPVLNIGNRQAGRYRYGYVLDSSNEVESIRNALDSITSLPPLLKSSRADISDRLPNVLPTDSFLSFLQHNF